MIGSVVRSLILSRPAIAALVGSRVYPIARPPRQAGAAVQTAIVYSTVSGVPERTQDGHAGLSRSRYQLNVWAGTHVAAEQTLIAVVAALDNFTGDVAGKHLGGVFVENVGDVPAVTENPASDAEYGKRLDIVIWHN